MAIDENFLVGEILKLNAAIANIGGKIDGFLQSQSAQQAEIKGIKDRLDDAETDIGAIKQVHGAIRNKILGASAVVSAAVGTFLTLGWPVIQKKIGL